jgi:hypothetical protein
MKTHPVSERGQVLVLIALAIIGLVGITGLAVDGSIILADRRRAQNAADSSSLAGALAYIRDCQSSGCNDAAEISHAEDLMELAALDLAIQNGYASDLLSSNIDINRPPVSGAYAGDSEYVQVIIYSTVSSTFAKVVGINELHNRVEAVALLQEESKHAIYDGNALVVLKPTSADCSGDFTFGGSATVTLEDGGVLVNSNNNTCAFQCGTGASGKMQFVGTGVMSIVGNPGYTISGCPANAVDTTKIISHADPVPFPPKLVLPEPDECAQTPADPLPDPDDSTKVTLYPGHYQKLPPTGTYGGVNLNNFSYYALSPGNYCVSQVLKDAGNNTVIKGDNVFIYIKQGGNFDITGGVVQITAPTDPDSPYYGYLIYVDPGPVDPSTGKYSGNPANCKITGTDDGTNSHEFTGAIYSPYCAVTVAGNSGPQGIRASIIAYEIKLSGNNALWFIYDADLMPQEYIPPATGIAH